MRWTAAISTTLSVAEGLSLGRNFSGPWSHLRGQFALKMGLAGVLAIWIAQWLRLPSPGWSLVTVMLLMLPNYLGGVADKSLARVLGTVVGGVVAVLVVGNFADETVLMLVSSCLFIAVCTYFFGGTHYPYAYFLAGLTFLVVLGRSLDNPEASWNVALWRVEEILVGVVASLVVSSVLWPRYARRDFLRLAAQHQAEFARALNRALAHGELPTESSSPEELIRRADHLRENLQQLRSLLLMGSRESVYFKAYLPAYREYLALLAELLESLFALQTNAPVRMDELESSLREPLKDLREALLQTWEKLSEVPAPGEDSANLQEAGARLQETWRRFTEALQALRQEGATLRAPLAEMITFAGRYSLISDIVESSQRALSRWEKLPRRVDYEPPVTPKPVLPWQWDPFWLGNAIRGGLITAASLLFSNWVQPPGMAFIPIWAFMFSITTRGYVATQGDLRAFTNLLRAGLWGVPLSVLVYLLAPWLVDYLAANLFYFGALFALGYYLYPSLPGFTYLGCLWLNFLVVVSSFDFNRALPFSTVMDGYVGGMLGLTFAAFGQRLLWPVLPQREFRQAFGEILRRLRSHFAAGRIASAERTELTALFAEARHWLEVMGPPEYPAEQQRVQRLLLIQLRQVVRCFTLATVRAEPMREFPEIAAQREFRVRLAPAVTGLQRAAKNLVERLTCELDQPADLSRVESEAQALQQALETLLSTARAARQDPALLAAQAHSAMHLLAWLHELESMAHLLLQVARHWLLLDRLGLQRDAVL